jgi:hypothetical protein
LQGGRAVSGDEEAHREDAIVGVKQKRAETWRERCAAAERIYGPCFT